jgi:ABC-type transporter Mla subunit MlaD
MPFISTRIHQQYIRQFYLFLERNATNDENVQLLRADIEKLQQIADVYTDTCSQLHNLAEQYNALLNRTRGNLRRQKRRK